MTKEEAFFEEAEAALSAEEEAEMKEYLVSVASDARTVRRAEAEIAALEVAGWNCAAGGEPE